MATRKEPKEYKVVIIGDKKKLTEDLSRIWAEAVVEKARKLGGQPD